jgi:hypothetical protein
MPAVYVAAGGAVLAVAALAVVLVSGQIEHYRDRSVSRALASADASRIEPLLPELRDFDPARRASVLLEETTRTGLIKYFKRRMDALADPRTGHYDYPAAEALLHELEALLPDSEAVQGLRERLAARKTAELQRKSNSPPQGQPEKSQGASDLAPSVLPSATPAAQPAAAVLRTQITAALAQPTITLSQAKTLAAAAEDLTHRGDPEAQALTLQLETGLAHAALQLEVTQGLDPAIGFAKGAYALFPASHELRAALAQLNEAANQRTAKQRQASNAATKKKIESLLASSHVDEAWTTSFEHELQRLLTLLPAADTYVEQVRSRAAALCLSQASTLRSQQHLPEARRLFELSARYSPDSPGLAQEEKFLEEAERTARVSSLEQKLLERAQADDIREALAQLAELRAVLPANDAFLTHDAPRVIAEADLRQAAALARTGRFAAALNSVAEAQTTAASMRRLAVVRARYVQYDAIDQHLTSRESVDVHWVRGELVRLVKQNRDEALAASEGLLRNLVVRINSTHDPRLEERLLQATKEIFGEDSVARVPVPSPAAVSK